MTLDKHNGLSINLKYNFHSFTGPGYLLQINSLFYGFIAIWVGECQKSNSIVCLMGYKKQISLFRWHLHSICRKQSRWGKQTTSQFFNLVRANVPHYMETSQLILKYKHPWLYKIWHLSKMILRILTIQNQLTGLYMTDRLTLNGCIQSNLAKLSK